MPTLPPGSPQRVFSGKGQSSPAWAEPLRPRDRPWAELPWSQSPLLPWDDPRPQLRPGGLGHKDSQPGHPHFLHKTSPLFKPKCIYLPKSQHLLHTPGPPAGTDREDSRSLRMQDPPCQMTIKDPELTRGVSRDTRLRAKPSPDSPTLSSRCFWKAPPNRAWF